MRSGGGADRGFFFPVHWVVHITGFGSFGRLRLSTFWSSYACAFTFSSRIMEVAFAYTLGFKFRFIPGLSLAFSRPPSLQPAAGSCCRCCSVVFFVQSSLFVSGVCNNECITLCFSPFISMDIFSFFSLLLYLDYLQFHTFHLPYANLTSTFMHYVYCISYRIPYRFISLLMISSAIYPARIAAFLLPPFSSSYILNFSTFLCLSSSQSSILVTIRTYILPDL